MAKIKGQCVSLKIETLFVIDSRHRNTLTLKQIALGSICSLEKPLLPSTKTKSQSHQSLCQSRVTSPTHSQGLYVLFCFRSAFICCILKNIEIKPLTIILFLRLRKETHTSSEDNPQLVIQLIITV